MAFPSVPLTPLFKLGSLAAGILPGFVADSVADGLGSAVSLESSERRKLVERHQRRVADRTLTDHQMRVAVRDTYRSYARYWADSLRLPHMSVSQIDQGFTHEGLERVAEAIDSGIGPILALPHLGGWEWAAAWITQVRGWEVAAVVERLEPPELFEWFLELRQTLGMEVIPLGPTAATDVNRAIRSKKVTCLLCDRDIAGTGIEVEFFGEKTTLPGGPATLAIRTGAPLLPTAVYFQNGKVHGEVGPPIDTTRTGRLRTDVERITQELAHRLESLIRRAPTQWHLMQPNWPSDYLALGITPPAPLIDLTQRSS